MKNDDDRLNISYTRDVGPGRPAGVGTETDMWLDRAVTPFVRNVSISEETYRRLEALRQKGFTFSELIADIVGRYSAESEAANQRALPATKPDDLNDRQWHVAILRFEGGLTLDRIGRAFGITRERVRQVEATILKRHPEFRGDAA